MGDFFGPWLSSHLYRTVLHFTLQSSKSDNNKDGKEKKGVTSPLTLLDKLLMSVIGLARAIGVSTIRIDTLQYGMCTVSFKVLGIPLGRHGFHLCKKLLTSWDR